MTRIACIDLLFQWPPDGGARVDLLHNLSHLAEKHDVRLFVPEWDWQIRRGSIRDLDVPFSIDRVPFSFFTFHRYSLPVVLGRRIREFSPDVIIVGDGWQMKPFVVSGVRDIPCYFRFYAYETTCLRSFGVAFRRGKRCDLNAIGNGFRGYVRCLSCALRWSLRGHSKLFLHELCASGAIVPDYYYRVRRLLSGARGLIVSNSFMAERLKQIHSNIAIIPGGIDTGAFGEKESEDRLVRGSDSSIHFLVAGRMNDPLKGFSTVKAAAAILSSRSSPCRILYTGDGSLQEKNLHPLGWLSHSEMVQHYQAVRATIIPSLWWEPFGVTALESMACGTPVIASDVGGLYEIVDSGVNGLLVPPGDENALVHAITYLADHPEKAKAMGLAARKKVCETYAWEKVTAQFSRFLELEK